MKKLLLLILVFVFVISSGQSQNFISISPSFGARGQTISTTVTGSGFFFTMGSAPSNWGDFYMQKGSTTILPSWVTVLNDDILDVSWPIPANAPIGNYQVVWDQFGFLNYIPGGFNVGDAFVSGTVFHDADSSGAQNGTENPMFNQKVLLLPDSSYSFTNSAGEYTLGTTFGTKDVKIMPSPIWNITTPSPITINVNNIIMPGNDFGLKGVTDFYGIDGSLTGGILPRCFRNVPYYLTFTNTGTVATQGEVIFIRSSNCTFVSSNIPPDVVNGNVYTWNYTNLLPGESRNIIVTLNLPGAATTISNGLQVIARDLNGNIVDLDESLLVQATLCAYDPNDKSVIPEGIMAPHYTLMSDTLDFVIRFQNTGNDTAFQVVILDTLDNSILDLNSFELIAHSHPVVVDLKPNGRVTFTFDNILLPDSIVNEPESHGFVRFRSRIKSGLPNNTVLNNTGYIYFDFNPAIVTNTTLNTLVYVLPVGIDEVTSTNFVQVLPNPVTNDAVVQFNNPESETFTLKVYDVRGELVAEQILTGERATVPAKLLQSGVYIYHLKNENGTRNHKGKFIVM